MAKAKKPASTSGPAADKTSGDSAKNTDGGKPESATSMPKTSRSKPSGAADAAKKSTAPTKGSAPAAAATAATSKTSEPVKMADPTPANVKKTATPDPSATTPPKPATPKSESKPAPAPQSNTASVNASSPKPTEEKRGSAFWPLVFGGAVAAALGFFAAEMNVLGTRDNTSDLRGQLARQQAQIAELQNVEPQMTDVEFPQLDGLTEEVSTLSANLSELETRLTEIENRPASDGTSGADAAAYERELEALQASVEEQRAEIQGLLENALSVEEATANMARTATLQAAVTRLMAAINGGQPYAAEVAELEANGMTDIPAALTETADTGVVTLINLQSRFPEAARAGLATARAAGADDEAGGVGNFLRRQLGARSVAPRDGTDPDAVLSRAEAAVRDGQLEAALAELDTLPENTQAAMQGWLADARARHAADIAAQDLSQRLTAN